MPGTPPTILIIDDDSDIRQALRDVLTREGYGVTTVGHGAEAIQQVQRERYGAALLDIQLMNPDGLSVMKAIKELDPKLPIIVLTGHSTVENNIGALLRGAFTCLAKPYDVDELTAALHRAVEVNHLTTRAEYVERELSESKERFRAVAESVPDAIVLADHHGLIISWNRAAETLFGYAEEEVLDQPLTLIMPARYREAHQKGLERLRATGEAKIIGKTMELHGLRKDGSEFPLELSLGTWKTATGTFYSGIIRNITERKRAEEALRESQERFRQLAETIREVFWMSDPEKNRMIYVSPGYEDIWGRTCESLYASPRSWLEAIHPDDRARVLQAALTKQVTGTYDEEYRIVRPNGSIRWIRDRAFPIRDTSGHVYRIAGIADDITERKKVEQDLRASEERLELAVQGSSDGLWDGRPLPGEPWSSLHTPVWYSPRFKAMLGFDEQEFDNVLGSWIAQLHPDDMDRVFAALSAHIERKEPYDVEYRLRTKQREYRWFQARGQAIWDDAGNLLRMAGSLQCITDRKRAEQRLHAQYATTRALEESATLLEATPKILRAVCDSLCWDLGALWGVDQQAHVLRCVDCWYGASAEFAEFASASRDLTFSPGFGLPGRVWTCRKPVWIADVDTATNFPRAAVALKAAAHGAVGFPILLGDEILGVLEFFSREARPPDDAQIDMMEAIGSQIGQFVERKRHAARLAKINECLLSFGKDANENINRLTGLCGELLDGACALYSYLDGELLHSIGQWHTPPGFDPVDKPDGHICCDVIKQGGSHPLLVRHLQETPYAQTDPNVIPYHLQTYFGQAVRRDGRYVGALCVVYQRDFMPNEDDTKLIGIMASAIGVEEERKKAEQALRQAYDATEKILASLPGAILIVNEDERVVYNNALAGQYFGEGRAMLVGCSVSEVLPVQEARRSRLLQGLKPHTAESGYWQQDREFQSQKRVYRYRLFPVAIRGSERPQTGLVIWDVTDEKQLQDQLAQAERLASLGTLVSGMAHEINNPAQAILGMAELMVEENEQEKIREYSLDIVGYAQHIATVVRDFAGYARQTSHDGESEIDLNERLTEAVRMVRRGPHFERVEVVTEFQPVPPIRARRTEIDQVFINLISNAVQAMKGNGKLTLATHLQGDSVVASISDTGCGIPQALLHRIFDPFFTTKEPGKGTGLGLSITYRIVAKYGGQINVESEGGVGTTFTITFPVETGPIKQEVPHV